LLMGQVKNGKTRIVEKTAQTLGEGWAAVYMYVTYPPMVVVVVGGGVGVVVVAMTVKRMNAPK